MKIKNTSFTLFRWQEYIWRPGEVIEVDHWDEKLFKDLMRRFDNLVEVKDKAQKREEMLARLEKARAARKKKNG